MPSGTPGSVGPFRPPAPPKPIPRCLEQHRSVILHDSCDPEWSQRPHFLDSLKPHADVGLIDEKSGLVAHDAGARAHAAVPAVAVRVVPRRAFGALHFALVEGDEGALVVFNRTGVLTDIAGVVNAAGQFAEIALFNGCEGAYADLGGFSDLLERDAPIAANRGQTKDVFFLYHLPASPGINL